jgi:A/G-specific adenine glycosylase
MRLLVLSAKGGGGQERMRRLAKKTGKPWSGVLLTWYDVNRRDLPWRAKAGKPADPYGVWLSEIMLQQTTVAAVAGYYRKFIARWPTVEALAAAGLDEVLGAWAGLGYYARARNLHACAKKVAAAGGTFPMTVEGLMALPGIGAYTAGAIAAIAFSARESAMDANAERVIARLYAIEEPLPAAKKRLRDLCRAMVPADRPGDFAQSLMDLGATVCTPRPDCARCPLAKWCEGRRLGMAMRLPVKAAKKARPLRRGAAFVATDKAGRVLLEKRPEKGLLGGMLQPPLGPWGENFPSADEAPAQAPFRAKWKKLPGIVRHTFTHFELEIEVYAVCPVSHPPSPSAKAGPSAAGESYWVSQDALPGAALPTVMRKILKHGAALKNTI